jgi:hypothetical protein
MISVKRIIRKWWYWADEQERVLSNQAQSAVETLLARTHENFYRQDHINRLDDALIQLSGDLIVRLDELSEKEAGYIQPFTVKERSPL